MHAGLPVSEEVCAMSIIRIKFEKGPQVRFISHLDMMNSFQRAIRRAGLEAEYSHGFNPQMQMVFGAPLSLGYTSKAEYADLLFAQDYEALFVETELGKQLPPGLGITKSGKRLTKKNIMADIAFAEYEFSIKGLDDVDAPAKKIMSADALHVEKTRKNKTKVVDIRPMIKTIDINSKKCIVLVKAGNSGNLNPRLLAMALGKFFEREVEFRNICRISQYVERNGELTDPLSESALETV